MTQDDVADLMADQPARISRTMISFIENGRNLPGLESLVSLSSVLHIDPAEVLDLIRTSGEPPADAGDRSLDELQSLALREFWAGEYRSALATYDLMLDRLPRESLTAAQLQIRRARIEINRAVVFRRSSALRAAQSAAEQAINLSTGLPDLLAEAYVCLAATLVDRGLLPLACDASARAVELASELDARIQGLAHNERGDVLYACGEFEEAIRAFSRARNHAVQAKDHHHTIKIEGNLGACHFAAGRLEDAGRHFEAAVKLARRHGDRRAEAHWLLEAGRLALAGGRFDDARKRTAAALRIAKPLELDVIVFRCEWIRHRLAIEADPEDPDSHRLAYLRRLWVRIKAHEGIPEVQEYMASVPKAGQS